MKHQKNIFEFLVVLSVAISLVYFSHKVILTYYFWRDDWHLLWTITTGSYSYDRFWLVKTGLMVPIIRYIYGLFESYYVVQWIGLITKIINVVILFYFIKSITGSKYAALSGLLFYAVYSGGLEAYSFVRQDGMLVGFLLVLFILLHKYLENRNKKYLYVSVVLWTILPLIFGVEVFFGRGIGIVIPYVFWILAEVYRKKEKGVINSLRKRSYLIFILLALSSYLSLLLLNYKNVDILKLAQQIYLGRRIYFGSIGSLLMNPYYYKKEITALYGGGLVGVYLGILSLVTLMISVLLFLKTKKKMYSLLSFSIIWIHSTYIINWLFGGGSTGTGVGSSHRYLAVSAIGVVLFTSVILSKIPRKLSYILLLVILILSVRYTKRITENDFWIRGEPIVGNFYSTVAAAVPEGKKARLILVEAPDNMKAPVVGWSLPWAYAYYKKLAYSEFPVVFELRDDAVAWLCAEGQDRRSLENTLGVTDVRSSEPVVLEEIYAWKLAENGDLVNRTDGFRNSVKECLKDK